MRTAGVELQPRVGVGAILLNERDEVLLGRRRGSHGAGEWALPGGSVAFGETLEQAVAREIKEETGLVVVKFTFVSVCDELRYIDSDRKHFVDISFLGRYDGGEPRVMEPEKCVEWRWFPLGSLPEPLMESTALTLRCYQDRVAYFVS